ncbi:GH25 family lysozyme [Pediococcus pentosaceus]|uniref:GH25 family lysozyme n=1 Tax=Pediococcus pentosaceus TaxID=1255 RepID=UPI003593A5F6
MNKRKLRAFILMVGAIFMAFFMPNVTSQAATRSQGTDWSKFQGYYPAKAYKSDEFSIAQLGGSYGGTLIDQATYNTQVTNGRAQGLRMHTYLWYGIGENQYNAKNMLDYYLPKVKTPKGSIVALDYEDGAKATYWNGREYVSALAEKESNTRAIIYGMRRIKAAGYTPMYYSGKPYTLAHVNYQEIVKEFGNKSLWIAAYPDYLVRSVPYWGVFPTMNGVGIYQFTSTYKAGGLDGNIDLTGITKSGYTTASKKQAQDNVKKAHKQAAKVVKYNQRGVFYPNRTLAVHYTDSDKSSQVATYHKGDSVIYNAVIIEHDYVWARYTRSNGLYGFIKLGVTNGPAYGKRVTHTYYTVKYGDSWWTIAQRNGLSMTALASQNGKTIYTTIYPGQRLVVR